MLIPRSTIPNTVFDSSFNPPFSFDTTLKSVILCPTSVTGIFRARVTWDTFVACWLLLEWPGLTELTRSLPLSYEAISWRGTHEGWDTVVEVLALSFAGRGMLTGSEGSWYTSDKAIQVPDWDFIYKRKTTWLCMGVQIFIQFLRFAKQAYRANKTWWLHCQAIKL